jgi:hypothetical protein
MKIEDLINQRVLVYEKAGWNSDIMEFKILEVSPSGNWTKVMNMHGNKFWKRTENIQIVEVLKINEKYPS